MRPFVNLRNIGAADDRLAEDDVYVITYGT
jgi:hypothetical protein